MKKFIILSLALIACVNLASAQFGRSEEEILRDVKITTNEYLEHLLYQKFQPNVYKTDEITIVNPFYFSSKAYPSVGDDAYVSLERKARNDDISAQYRLWELAESGDYSHSKGERWLKIAADNGHQDALEYLGFNATFGFGMDEFESLYWLLVGSYYDNPNCMDSLAARYENGEGVKKDLKMANILHREAAKRSK